MSPSNRLLPPWCSVGVGAQEQLHLAHLERGLLHLLWVQRLTDGTAAPQEPLDLESRPASLPQLVRGWRRRRERRREAGPKPQDRKEQEPAPPDLLPFSREETLRRCPADPLLFYTPRPPFGATVQGQNRRPAAWGGPPVPLPPYPRTPNLLLPKAGEAAFPSPRSRPSSLEGRAASRDLAPGSCPQAPPGTRPSAEPPAAPESFSQNCRCNCRELHRSRREQLPIDWTREQPFRAD